LGINWFYYVTREEKQKRDKGRRFDYLNDENKDSKKYAACFRDLYNELKGIVDSRRSIGEIEKGLILPKETIFYSKPLPYSSVNPSEREEERKNGLKYHYPNSKVLILFFLIQTTEFRRIRLERHR